MNTKTQQPLQRLWRTQLPPRCENALDNKGSAVLAVSGGRSPIPFFQALSQKDLDWQKVGITLVDERIVPTTHADSNTALAHEYLLQNKAAAATWIPVVEAGKS